MFTRSLIGWAGIVELLELLDVFERAGNGHLGTARNKTRYPIGLGLHSHDTSDIAHGGSGGHGIEGYDLADSVPPVFFRHVTNDLLTTVIREVHVNVGKAHAVGIQEALERQVIADGIHVGDAERIGDQAARGGSARHTAHAVAAGVVGVVPDDQEVRDEPLGAENAEFIVQLLLEGVTDCPIAFPDALQTERVQVFILVT